MTDHDEDAPYREPLDGHRPGIIPGDAPAWGHNSANGRNVIRGRLGHDGHDIFRAAVEMSRMPMLLTDPGATDNPIVFVNRAFETLTGYEQHEVLGRNCRLLSGSATDKEALARIRAAITGRYDIHEEIYNYRRDGSGFWNALFISPVFDADGELCYFFASQLDVTRRREAEQMLRQSQRMETLGAMAAGVAHEFNNLMTVVSASIERAHASVTDERLRTDLERADWGARRATRLTQQMLSFARRQFHERQHADLSEIVAGFDSIIQQVAGPGVTVRLALSAEPLECQVDIGQLELALLNLVRNAADAMGSDRGTVTVSTEAMLEHGRRMVVLGVTDSGEGMDAQTLRRATEPFFTTKPRRKGTGLGLSMVSGFANQSGGRLVIDSAPGRGTTVRIALPAA